MKDLFGIENHFEGKNRTFSRKEKSDLEWEESLIVGGSGDKNNEEGIQRIGTKIEFKRLRWFIVIVILLFSILLGKTAYLQIIQGKHNREMAEHNRIRIKSIMAPRGIIYDRNNKMLVHNVPSFDIVIIPGDFFCREDSERERVISQLSEAISIPSEEIKNKLAEADPRKYEPIVIKNNIERNKALVLEANLSSLPGVSIEKNPIREYIGGDAFSHILGYTGKITKEELELKNKNFNEYLLNDYIGKDGIEAYYENILRGKNGKKQVEVDSLGNERKIIAIEDSIAGKDVVLTIDFNIQNKLKEVLEYSLELGKSKKGSIVAINPQNGEILGMVSLPTYDNNLFARGISENDYKRLVEDKSEPLFFRAIAGVYPPGSTIKPAIASAALQEGIIDTNTIIEDKGFISIANEYDPSSPYVYKGWDSSGLGPMNVYSAIAWSSDIYFYYVGGGYADFKGLGLLKIKEYLEKFGFGSKLGIDLPSESSGRVPDDVWKKETLGEDWYLGDTYNLSIGQGFLEVTPLQLASYTAAIANGGKLFKPHVVKQINDTENNKTEDVRPEIIRENFISRDNLNIVRDGMRQTVTDGSASLLNSLPIEVCAKTGTAQFADNTQEHAWFIAFAPYQDPEIALVVLVEGGGSGAKIAAPAANEFLSWYFTEYKKLKFNT